MGEELTEEAVIFLCPRPKMTWMRLVMGTILTRDVREEVLSMMMKGRNKYDRQQDRKQDEYGYALFQGFHNDKCT